MAGPAENASAPGQQRLDASQKNKPYPHKELEVEKKHPCEAAFPTAGRLTMLILAGGWRLEHGAEMVGRRVNNVSSSLITLAYGLTI
jgi:hypothetical protein